MKAVFINQYGDHQQLQYGELAVPTISEQQVLIRVKAAGVNPVDFHIRNGMLKDSGTHELPLVLGWDAAGIIEQVGTKVSDLKVGDEVFVFSPIDQQGAYSELLAVDASLVVKKPTRLDYNHSAGVPLAATTAWQALVEGGQIEAGQRVLIHNASGGVGSFAVQIAKALGAYVIGTSSAANEDYVRGLGADEWLDYRQQDFEAHYQDLDVVLAAVGGDRVVERSLQVLKPGGRLISLFDEIDASLAVEADVSYQRWWVRPDGETLARIRELIDREQLRVTLDSIFTLHDAAMAHRRSESQRARGKIILTVE